MRTRWLAATRSCRPAHLALFAFLLALATGARAEPARPCGSHVTLDVDNLGIRYTKGVTIRYARTKAGRRLVTHTEVTNTKYGDASGTDEWVFDARGLPVTFEQRSSVSSPSRWSWEWQGGVLRTVMYEVPPPVGAWPSRPPRRVTMELRWVEPVTAIAPSSVEHVDWYSWMDPNSYRHELYRVLFAGAAGAVEAVVQECEAQCVDKGSVRLSYDASGYLVAMRSPEERSEGSAEAALTYRDGRLHEVKERDSSGKPRVHRFSYDEERRLLGVESDHDGRVSARVFTRDARGRLLTSTMTRRSESEPERAWSYACAKLPAKGPGKAPKR